MIISGKTIQPAAKVYGNQTKTAAVKAKGTVVKQSPDEVILSTNAQDFGGLINQLQSLSDVRADKVQAIGSQVAQGTYHIDSYAIADTLLSNSKVDKMG